MDYKVLVVVVTYNGMKWIDRCLDSVVKSSIHLDAMVVDNCSTDGTCGHIEKEFPQVILIRNKENQGFGKANNIGLQYAVDNGYDYVYLLNQDAWLQEDTVEKLITIQRRSPLHGILSPLQCQADLRTLDLNFARTTCDYNSNPELHALISEAGGLDSGFKEIYDVPNVMAAHWLISRDCILATGGFSPSFPHYGEDYNYCDRAMFHGFCVGVCPSCRAVHDRKNRRESKRQLRYMYCYVKPAIALSNIHAKGSALRRIVILQLSLMFRYKTMPSMCHLFKLLRSLSMISHNKKMSYARGTFLKG